MQFHILHYFGEVMTTKDRKDDTSEQQINTSTISFDNDYIQLKQTEYTIKTANSVVSVRHNNIE